MNRANIVFKIDTYSVKRIDNLPALTNQINIHRKILQTYLKSNQG